MTIVRAKKNLGQHFLKDKNIAQKIVESLSASQIANVLEVGPGMGVLTQFLLEKSYQTYVIEIDTESVEYLQSHFSQLQDRIISGDFLRLNLQKYFSGPFAVIGNFPYNISSQIFFKVLENREQIPEVVGMIQKEVAERIAAPPGSKTYGIMSVLLQAFYHIEYLFTVSEHVFIPPPKVKSAVVRLTRNDRQHLDCDEKLFFQVVKMAFNQRRKTMRNSLKAMITDEALKHSDLLALRPEQLSVSDFELLTRLIREQPKNI
ncbi:MAG: 16S rRNA (adenine(1518)-N(6)/adenine(1519)-N(6))-dimethyltransferase [Bacteroidetes bacterium GWF2_42_66]|nr:MAG: 16S rRNA (adenine(1518)-N(6)/adenine(1519)-N(6))-dimethyltransferase [Bacteroidetes bacterium GWA2_42_15]OFY01470.1 MAG: 16S rRNA (adenine(1518)-N(6)/adenine(1519)-N(6))-dimethyltransferase [Bacteroidetes bacterium GWE2_42_39]OFY43349.1 MAG: 16S rRNA (adenine(1518)-N(6)/adenine(1519)-N(6))-dimethyltransferase [Bacteroidetes bacterium GWF2_42_66]HBL77468.1 16S rRNA (adenine(1518)-N(6)/adenine(1519)-N(6))-dimethyltransferase [Prolixibacteraceae bacterium]HCR91306.1 16S rRNA (adenine(1518)